MFLFLNSENRQEQKGVILTRKLEIVGQERFPDKTIIIKHPQQIILPLVVVINLFPLPA